MWSNLAESSIVDLAGKVNEEKKNNVGSWIKDVERWYNLLQKIEKLEKKINYEEALRSRLESDRVPDGKEYYASQMRSLDALREQAATQKQLADSYQEYFNKRREELNSEESPFYNIFEFDEAGKVNYKTGGLEKLAEFTAVDDKGNPKYDIGTQYQMMIKAGFGEYMKYSGGKLIEMDEDNIEQFYYDSVQAGWENIEKLKTEMDDLAKNQQEALINSVELETKINELLQDIVDNQLDLENNILKAIEDREQKIIDHMTDERKALENSSSKYFQGLEDALSKERQLYQKQQDQSELTKLQRRLVILQRSGGAASEIASLQEQIDDKMRDSYFEEQENAIQDAKDAADLQLEKMQEQIDIATETLDYQKEHGLLYDEVAEIMKGSAEQILAFITGNDTEWLSKSTLGYTEDSRALRSSIEQWEAYRNDTNSVIQEAMESTVVEFVEDYAMEQTEAWREEILRTTQGALTATVQSVAAAYQTAAETLVETYAESAPSTQVDSVNVNFNIKEIADIASVDKLQRQWKNNSVDQFIQNKIKQNNRIGG